MTESLLAGRVGRPHGLDGSFHVVDAAPVLLRVGVAVDLEGAVAEVLARKGTEEHPIVRVSLASDRTAAAALRGRALRVAKLEAPPLSEDEYWPEDLVGCRVVAGARELGAVRRMLGYPSCELLELDDQETGTLIPLVRDAIRSIDLDARRIEVDAAFLGLG